MKIGYLVVISKHDSAVFHREHIKKDERVYEYFMGNSIYEGIKVFLDKKSAIEYLKSILPVEGGTPLVYQVLIPDADAESFV